MVRVVAFCLFALLCAQHLPAADAPAAKDEAAGLALFEAKIRPVLVQHCYKCHSASSGKAEGSLTLDTREGVRRGGDRGPAVAPGDPQASWLLTAISHADADLKMPPKKDKLAADVIRDFEAWIRQGAPDPRSGNSAAGARPPVDIATGRKFWSFQKPRAAEVPAFKDHAWPKRDLDHFVLARLDAAGLAPSPDAHPATLLRRVHFDLVGLPPEPAAVERFVARCTRQGLDAALAAEVDELLASQHFGERWGRHWLDVARFAESSGKEANLSFPYAWRYRDYVIECFQQDTPFDRFLTEQIAGDLLPFENDRERARLLIATGFLALGPKNLDEANALQFLADVVDEQIDSVSRAVLGQSVACARCHDHKFDPFSMHDYYALAGVFASTKTCFGTYVTPVNRIGGDPLPLPTAAGQRVFHESLPAKKVDELRKQLAALQKEQADGMAAIQKAVAAGEDPEQKFSLRDALRIFWVSGGIEGQLEKVSATGEALPLAMGVLDAESIIDVPLLERGELSKAGGIVPRGFPSVIALDDVPRPTRSSGRLELARWLTHREHPLTARVMVNRVWHWLFGAGLVASVDNFGMTGSAPSHPELLDTLAVRFTESDWSVKQLVREIVLSRCYRQASTFNEQAFKIDPENRLLWRASKRRLDAEVIRDAMLSAAGDLDPTPDQASLVGRVIGDRPIALLGLDPQIPADLDGSRHRSVYLPVLRDRLPDVLELFDFAEPSLVTGARETTNVPVQALYLMNSPFVQARAESLANRLQREAKGDAERIGRAFRLCFGREPDEQELELGKKFLQPGGEKLLVSYCQALLCTAEFRNLD